MGGKWIPSGLVPYFAPYSGSTPTNTTADWLVGVNDNPYVKMCLIRLSCSSSALYAYVAASKYNSAINPFDSVNLNTAWNSGNSAPVATSLSSDGYGVSSLSFGRVAPTMAPTQAGYTYAPTQPTRAPTSPTISPTTTVAQNTPTPTQAPSSQAVPTTPGTTPSPTQAPTVLPSNRPTLSPTISPTQAPSSQAVPTTPASTPPPTKLPTTMPTQVTTYIDPPGNVLLNPGAEQDSLYWTNNCPTGAKISTTVFHTGSKSFELSYPSGTTGNCKWDSDTYTMPQNSTVVVLGGWIKTQSFSATTTTLRAVVTLSDNTNQLLTMNVPQATQDWTYMEVSATYALPVKCLLVRFLISGATTNSYIWADDWVLCNVLNCGKSTPVNTVIYVDPTSGSDTTGSGSVQQPFKSFAKATTMAALQNVSRVLCLGTSHMMSGSETIVAQGNVGAPILVQPVETTCRLKFTSFILFDITSSAKYLQFTGFDISGVSDVNNHWSLLQNFWSYQGQTPYGGGIAFNVNGQQIGIVENSIHDCYQKAINIESARYATIEANIIYNIGHQSLSGGHGIMRQQGTGTFADADDPAFFRWDIRGNLIFNVGQRIYSWVPRKGYINLVLDEGKSINIDETPDKNFKARISDNVVAFGTIDHIRLKSTANLIVANNSIWASPWSGSQTDGITDAAAFTSNNFPGLLVEGNAVMTFTGTTSLEVNNAGSSSPAPLIRRNYISGGGVSVFGVQNADVTNLGSTTSLFMDPAKGNFTVRVSNGVPATVGAPIALLWTRWRGLIERYNITVSPSQWISNHVRNIDVLIKALPGSVYDLNSRTLATSILDPTKKALYYNVIAGQEAQNGGQTKIEIVLNDDYVQFLQYYAVDDLNTVYANVTISVVSNDGVLSNDGALLGWNATTVSAIQTGTPSNPGASGTVGGNLLGTFGTLNMKTDGSYTYQANTAAALNLQAGVVVYDYFTYTRSGGGGSTGTDTAQLRITIVGTSAA